MIADSTQLRELLKQLEPIANGPVQLQQLRKDRRGDATSPAKYVPVELNRTARDWWDDIGADTYGSAKYGIVIMDGPYASRYLCSFSIAYFPGCCALAIGTGAVTRNPFQNKGVNIIANKIRMEISKLMGYTTYMATDVSWSTASMRTFEKNGLKEIYACQNKRTNNLVKLFMKEL